MTGFEISRILARPLTSPFHRRIRRDVTRLLRQGPPRPEVLDVGGRRSPYTIGLPARITVLDVPRKTELQQRLNLGLSHSLFEELGRHRSNVTRVVLEDMTHSSLPSESFDGVVCVEVVEHVAAYESFVAQIARVLRPGGWSYFTTPNGDYIKNEGRHFNPDHVKHFTRQELIALLSRWFDKVRVSYGIRMSRHYTAGHRTKSPRRPMRLLESIAGNVITGLRSRGLDDEPMGTVKLFAMGYKAGE